MKYIFMILIAACLLKPTPADPILTTRIEVLEKQVRVLSGDIFHLAEKSELRWSYSEGLGGMVEALLMKGRK
jgi:hypothetical protein